MTYVNPTMGAATELGYIAEVNPGVTPASPTLQSLPVTDINYNGTVQYLESADINVTRQVKALIAGNRSTAGDISVEMRKGNYDDFLAALFNSSWATNVLVPGTTLKTFTLERHNADSTLYQSFTGVSVDKMTVTITPKQLISAKFALLGYDFSTITGTSVSASPYTAVTAHPQFVPAKCTVKEGGTTYLNFTSVTFTVDNTQTLNETVGSATPTSTTSNWYKVTGTVTGLLTDGALQNKYKNDISTTLEVDMTDGTDTHIYLFPNVKITTATTDVKGNAPIIFTMNFQGIYDGTNNASLKVTRTS